MNATSSATSVESAARVVVDRIVQDASVLFEAAEEILFGLEVDDSLSVEQAMILRQAGIDGPTEIEMQRSRIAAVKDAMNAAGSNKELVEAEREMIRATREEREKRPGLEAQLAEIQSKLSAVVQARQSAAADLHRLTEAREKLRRAGLLPSFMRERHERDSAVVKRLFYKRIGELEVRLSVIDGVAKLAATDQGARLHCQAVAPHLLTEQQGRVATVDERSWSSYQAQLQRERPSVERKLQELRSERDAELAKVDHLLDYYVDRLP